MELTDLKIIFDKPNNKWLLRKRLKGFSSLVDGEINVQKVSSELMGIYQPLKHLSYLG